MLAALGRDFSELTISLDLDAPMSEGAGSMATVPQVSTADPDDTYLQFFRSINEKQAKVFEGKRALDNREFGVAHSCFGSALEIDWYPSLKARLVSDFVTTGLIAFSLANDAEALRTLVARCGSEFGHLMHLSLRLLISEIAMRRTSDEMLQYARSLDVQARLETMLRP